MLISPLQNTYRSQAARPAYTPSAKQVSFGKNVSDVFIKSARKVFSSDELLKILNGNFRRLNKTFFDSLSKKELQFCIDWANATEKQFSGFFQFSPKAVMPEDVQDLIKYVDYYCSGLQEIAKKANKSIKDVLLVGIGQSPVATIKLLELAGINTANCPMSGLTRFNEPLEKYVTKENVDKYFSYWSKFGFDLDELFGNKLVIFTDHEETGRTFEVFKKIIKRIINLKKTDPKYSDKKPADIKFLSLNKIFAKSKKSFAEKIWGRDFEDSVYHTSYLKTMYSPLFKLPLPQISEIEKLHEKSKGSARNIRFNRLAVLLYDSLYNPQSRNIPIRHSNMVNADRMHRLSFYCPDITQ